VRHITLRVGADEMISYDTDRAAAAIAVGVVAVRPD
jgi:hypothetical protein